MALERAMPDRAIGKFPRATTGHARGQRIFAARSPRARKRLLGGGGSRGAGKEEEEKEKEEEEEEIEPPRSLAWRIDDASKINVNTTKLVPAVFARGNGISVFTNSIDNISSFPLPLLLLTLFFLRLSVSLRLVP